MKRILLFAGLALFLAALIEAKSVAGVDDGRHDEGVGRTKRHYPSWGRRSYWRDMWRDNQWWDQDWWNDWAGWDDADVWDAYDWSAYPWNGDWDYYGYRYYRSADTRNRRYRMEPLRMTWEEAVKECDKMRMCLSMPETEQERNTTATIECSEAYWLGGSFNDLVTPGSWRWENGRRIVAAPWLDARSEKVTEKRCLAAQVGENAGKWIDDECDERKFFLCQTQC